MYFYILIMKCNSINYQCLTSTIVTFLFCLMPLVIFFFCLLCLFIKVTSFLFITNLSNGCCNAVIVALFSTKQPIIHFSFRYVSRFISLQTSNVLKFLAKWLHSVIRKDLKGLVWVRSLPNPDRFMFHVLWPRPVMVLCTGSRQDTHGPNWTQTWIKDRVYYYCLIYFNQSNILIDEIL